jgi:AbiV family abortive infection protein
MNKHEKSHMEGAQLCLENAWTLKASAELLQKCRAYGLARSLFILAGEEAIKAHITATFAFTPNSDRKEFKDAYRLHAFKHDRIKEVIMSLHQAVSSFKTRISDAVAKLVADGFSEEKAKRAVEEESEVKQIAAAIKQYDDQKYDINDMIDWWNEANKEKNNGLYVNINATSEWTVPQDYKEQDVVRAKTHCELLMAFIYFFLQDLKSAEGFKNMKANVISRGDYKIDKKHFS